MKFAIDIDRAAAIKAGKEAYGKQIIDVPLSDIPAHLHAEIAGLNEYEGVTRVDYSVNGVAGGKDPAPPVFAEANAAAVIAALRHRLVVRADRAAREQAAEIEREAALEQYIAGALAVDINAFIQCNYGKDYSVRLPNIPAAKAPGAWPKDGLKRAEAALAERIAQAQEIAERRAAEVAQLKADEAAAAKRGVQALREWAEAHGSERLRLMLEMDVGEWVAVAEREWQDAHAPEGYTHGTYNGDERKKPTLEELQELKALRAAVAESGGALSEPTIDWVIRDDERFAAAEVYITAPNGEGAWYSKRIGEQ